MKKIEELWQYDVVEDIKNGNLSKLSSEVEKGWDLNEPLCRFAKEGGYVLPIQVAIQNNNLESLKFLIEHGANLDTDHDHAFFFAVQYADEEIIRYVVEQGASIGLMKSEGVLTAYDFVIQRKRLELIPLVIELGLPIVPYAQDAFIWAILHKYYDATNVLLKYGIDINFHKVTNRNTCKNTPLCAAAWYGDDEMVQYLLDHGADPSIPNQMKRTPYQLALLEGKVGIVKIIKKYEIYASEITEEIKKKLPFYIIDFIGEKEKKLEVSLVSGLEIIPFLTLDELIYMRIGRKKRILLSYNFELYRTICLLWNGQKKCVSYYDYELKNYGDFNVSFSEFLENPERYINGIFTNEYVVD